MTEGPGSADDISRRALEAYQNGDLAQAETGLRQALALFTQAQDHGQAAQAANNLAVILMQVDQPEEARLMVEGTPILFEQSGDRLRAAQAYGNLASACEACGDLGRAESCFQQSLKLFQEIQDREGASLVLQRLSQLRLRQGQPLDALAAMQASLAAAPGRGFRRGILRRLLSLPGRIFPH